MKIYSRGKLRTLWHLTRRKDFKPSEKIKPVIGAESRPVLYATTDPYFWTHVITWAEGRRWAAEIDILPSHPPVRREDPILPEFELDPRHVRVVRVVPMAEAIALSTTEDEKKRAGAKRKKRLRLLEAAAFKKEQAALGRRIRIALRPISAVRPSSSRAS
jgi:hypothetical protein